MTLPPDITKQEQPPLREIQAETVRTSANHRHDHSPATGDSMTPGPHRIAIVSTLSGNPWGGSENLWAAMAQQALSAGHQVAVSTIAWPHPAEQLKDLRQQGATLWRRPGGWRSRLQRRCEPRLGLPSLRKLLRWRPEVVCFNLSGSYDLFSSHLWALPPLLERHGIPYVILSQANGDAAARILSGNRRRIAADIYTAAARVVLLSHVEIEMVERQLAVALPRAVVGRNPVNSTSADALQWPESKVASLACVGRLQVRHKGQDVLLAALATATWQQRDWQLSIYGDGPDRAYLEDLAEHYRLRPRIHFRGYQADVEEIWRRHQMLLLPSRIEGVPATMVEAMLAARPCLVTDVGGMREWIDQETGYLAEAPTPLALGRALQRALGERDRWSHLGSNAREKAFRMYDPQPGESFLRLLCQCVAEHQRGTTDR